MPDRVLENGGAMLYWDRSLFTDKLLLFVIVANKPDIVVIDGLEQLLRNDCHVKKKNKWNTLEYKDLFLYCL